MLLSVATLAIFAVMWNSRMLEKIGSSITVLIYVQWSTNRDMAAWISLASIGR